MGLHVEVGVTAEPDLVQPQRIDIGHQVSAVAVGGDQLDDTTRAFLSTIESGLSGRQRTGSTGCPATEDLVPETVREQRFVDGAQEVTGFRALDDPRS